MTEPIIDLPSIDTPYRLLIDGSVATVALADPAPASSKAESIGLAANGVIKTNGRRFARIVFGATDTNEDDFTYQVIGWSRVLGLSGEGWIPRVLAAGEAQAGTDVYGASGAGLGASGNLFCDEISDTVGEGAVIFTVANTRAVLEVPLFGSERIEVQTDLDGGDGNAALTVDCFIQLTNQEGVGDDAANLNAIAADMAELTSAPVQKDAISLVKALAGSPVPVALVAAETFCTSFSVRAARAGGVNVGDVFIGLSDVISGTKNYYKLVPDAVFTRTARAGTKFDLNDWYIDGETGIDGVIGTYEPV